MRTPQTTLVHRLLLAITALGLTIGAASPAGAQGFISPFIGYDFGGDSGCPDLQDCANKQISAGVGLGVMGNVLGIEGEIGYAPNFFGDLPGLKSSLLTVMGNVMLVPKFGPIRPYVLAGVGLMKSHVELAAASTFATDSKDFGWDAGGGLIVLFGDHVGIRGDVRYFHAFQDFTFLGFDLNNTKLDYGRASAGLVLKF